MDATEIGRLGEAAKAAVLGSGLALPPLSDADKAALKGLESPVISAEGVMLKAVVAEGLARIPFFSRVAILVVDALIDKGLQAEKAKLDEALS